MFKKIIGISTLITAPVFAEGYKPCPYLQQPTIHRSALGISAAATLGGLYGARRFLFRSPLAALGSLTLASLGARSFIATEKYSPAPRVITNERFPNAAYSVQHFRRIEQPDGSIIYARHLDLAKRSDDDQPGEAFYPTPHDALTGIIDQTTSMKIKTKHALAHNARNWFNQYFGK